MATAIAKEASVAAKQSIMCNSLIYIWNVGDFTFSKRLFNGIVFFATHNDVDHTKRDAQWNKMKECNVQPMKIDHIKDASMQNANN